jgi:hypothetical protein
VSPLQVVTLCIRLAALVWAFFALAGVVETALRFSGQAYAEFDATFLVFFTAVQLVICAGLWFFPATVARRLLPSLRDAEPAVPESPFMQWQTVAVVFVGLWALAQAIPDIIYWVTLYSMAETWEMPLDDLRAIDRAGMIATAAELAIGLWLVIGARGWAALFFRIRSAGLQG